MRKYLLINLLIVCFISCSDDDEGISVNPDNLGSADVIILNEGNFGFGNGSISIFSKNSGVVENKVFQASNMGRPIGDVVQSMIQMDNRYFIVVNNSSKIEVVEKGTFRSVGSIAPFNSPRYILPIDSTKAYVSDLYEDKIYIINPQDLSISGTIDVGGWVEEMTMVNGQVFACHMDSNQLLVINTSENIITNRIPTNHSPQHIAVDKHQKVWVSCSGGFEEDLAALYRINSQTLAVEAVMTAFDSTNSFGEIELNAARDRIYYLADGGVFFLDVEDTLLHRLPYISQVGFTTFYGLAVDSLTDDIYVCDAIDYQQRGVIHRFDKDRNLISQFRVGIIPGAIHFVQ